MSLAARTMLGPYEILAPLGAGGMGEVYRARDAKLEREVAIKVLPSHLAEDPGALARFEREAKAVAALSHPNILAIFDFGKQDQIAYAVTELLEGETLRARLASGPLPVRKAVEYGVQIAHGLAAAHGKGIVHRDLKPENVFVTDAGHVKILDFGLARVASNEADSTRSPTAVAATEPGTVMGTVGYMSPEQVRGKPADHRSDIFSFGTVLYEMLSGRRAFTGESAAETMAAIAREDPPAISATNANVPAGLDDVVRHCLENSPAERFQTASDLAFALQALSGHSTPRSGTVAVPATRRSPLGPLLAAAVALVLAGTAYSLGLRRGHAAPPVFHRLTFRRGTIPAARFSADGRTVVYSAAWQGGPLDVYSTRIDSTESRQLGLGKASLLALSASDDIAILRNAAVDQATYWSVLRGTLASVALAGGEPRDLLQEIEFADFAPDGRTLAIVRHHGNKRVLEFPPGKDVFETAGWIGEPRVGPNGLNVAFLEHPHLGEQLGAVCLVDASKKTTTLASGFARAQGLAWSSTGKEIWFTATREGSARALYGVSLSGSERLIYRIPGALTLHDVSRDGRALLAREDIRRETRGRGSAETSERDLSWLDYTEVLNVSRDGTSLGLIEMGDGGAPGRKVYLRKFDGSPPTLVGSEFAGMDLSQDGKWILTIRNNSSAHPQIALVPTGPGDARLVETAPMDYVTAEFSSDGTKVFLLANNGKGFRHYVQDIAGGGPRAITPEGLVSETMDFLEVSPDAETIVARDLSGDAALWPVRGGEPRPIRGLDSRREAVLGFTEKGLLYVSPVEGVPRPVFRLDPVTGAREHFIDLQPNDPTGVNDIDVVTVTQDGRAYAYSYVRRSCDLYVVEGLK